LKNLVCPEKKHKTGANESVAAEAEIRTMKKKPSILHRSNWKDKRHLRNWLTPIHETHGYKDFQLI
jgi:hypothetical protein